MRRSGRQPLGRVRARTDWRWRWPGDVEVMVPLEGLVDAGGREGQAEKNLAKLVKDMRPPQKKLGRPELPRSRAPAGVLDKDKARLAELEAAIAEAAASRLTGSDGC